MAADRGTETEVEVARGAPECQGPREGKCQDINANKKEWREDDKSCGCSGDEGDAAGGRDRDKTHHHHHQRHHPAGNNHTVRPSKDQDVAKPYRMVPPDGGWGWMVALGTFLIVTLLPPLRPCFGVLFSGYLLAAGSSSTSTAWIFSLMCFLWFISGLFSRPLTQEFGWRPVALSGSAMACVGMTLSAIAPSPAFLFFSFSLLTGFGGGIVTCQCFTILPHYFQRLRGLTNAIMMSGICTGLFVGPPFARYLQDTYGFRGATLILGGVLFNSCIGASFFHPYQWHQKKVPAVEQPEELQVAPLPINSKAKGSPSLTHGLVMSPSALSFVGSTGEPEGDVSLSARARLLGRLEGWKTSASSSRQSSRYNSTLSLSSMDAGSLAAMPLDDEQEKAHRKAQRGRQDSLPVRVIKSIIKDMGALKSLRACIICFGATMSISARLNFLMMVPFAMMDAGFSKDTAAWSVSVSAGCNLVTRVLVSVLSDFPRFNKRLTYMFGFMLVASSITAFTVFSTPNTLLAVMAVYGVGVGASMGIYNLVIIDVMGVERLAEVFGASSCCVAVGFICIGPLIGFIRDVTQSYAISMRVAAGMYVLGLAAWAFMSQAERYDLRRELRKAGKEATKA